jgi:hypothetical protein
VGKPYWISEVDSCRCTSTIPPVNCFTCDEIFHQYNLTHKYCSAACRNKARYAKLKDQLAKVQPSSIAEQLARSQERVNDLETRIKDVNQLEQENEALRIAIQQLEKKLMPFLYRIELRKISITQVIEQPFVDFYLDNHGNKTIDMNTMYLSIYSDGGLLRCPRSHVSGGPIVTS